MKKAMIALLLAAACKNDKHVQVSVDSVYYDTIRWTHQYTVGHTATAVDTIDVRTSRQMHYPFDLASWMRSITKLGHARVKVTYCDTAWQEAAVIFTTADSIPHYDSLQGQVACAVVKE